MTSKVHEESTRCGRLKAASHALLVRQSAVLRAAGSGAAFEHDQIGFQIDLVIRESTGA
ncbi:hypothetical protein [Cryobacterium serini]|uniref:hypothetical protein n=1 Tax=Cryobacterium serini TaxID=1259201 RepID=UPI00141B0818|nr:hypothetical protein [Cryobacterium serini]